MDEEAVGATDNIVTEFATYEDFLDSQITPLDLYYLEVIFFSFICLSESNLLGTNSESSSMLKLQSSRVR